MKPKVEDSLWPIRRLVRLIISAVKRGRKYIRRDGGVGGFIKSIRTGHSLKKILDFDHLPADELFCLPSAQEREIFPTRPIGGFGAPEKIGSGQLRILRAENIVFDTDSEVLLCNSRVYVQRLKKSVSPKTGENLMSESGIASWNSRSFAFSSHKKLSDLPSYASGIVINGNFASNWYHWLVGPCARGFLVAESKSVPADIPWLLPESARGSQRESLFRLLVGNEREVIFVPFGPARVLEAFLVQNPARELRNPLRWSEQRFRENGEFHWEIFEGMRQRALDTIDRSTTPLPPPPGARAGGTAVPNPRANEATL